MQSNQRDLSTLSTNDLARIVRAAPGHFSAEAIASAKIELAHRKIDWRPRSAPVEEEMEEQRGWPDWVVIGLFSISFNLLSKIFSQWMSSPKALALAIALAWLAFYLAVVRRQSERKLSATRYWLAGLVVVACILIIPALWSWIKS